MPARHVIVVTVLWVVACGGSATPTTTPLPSTLPPTTDPLAEARETVVAGYTELALADDLYITQEEAECAGGIVADALPLDELVARAEEGITDVPDGTDVAGLTPEAFAACIDPARYLSAIIGEGGTADRTRCLDAVLRDDPRLDRRFLLGLLSGESPEDLGAVVQDAVADCP